MKREYDNLMRKVKIETRELETLKKKMSEDVEKVKQEELDKIKKEKKALETRTKNLNLVSNTSKREREEIDQLRKDFNKMQADSELKHSKMKVEIERLTKLNNDLKQKNKELGEDLRSME